VRVCGGSVELKIVKKKKKKRHKPAEDTICSAMKQKRQYTVGRLNVSYIKRAQDMINKLCTVAV
jgi:hypothetical protein